MESKLSDPCQSVISSLEAHSSRLDKEAIILAQAEWANNEFFKGVRLALDPTRSEEHTSELQSH